MSALCMLPTPDEDGCVLDQNTAANVVHGSVVTHNGCISHRPSTHGRHSSNRITAPIKSQLQKNEDIWGNVQKFILLELYLSSILAVSSKSTWRRFIRGMKLIADPRGGTIGALHRTRFTRNRDGK